MKYNDYIYGFSVLGTYHYNIPFRIKFVGEIEEGEIFKLILENAVEQTNKSELHREVKGEDINFKFISLVFSGEYEERVDNTK